MELRVEPERPAQRLGGLLTSLRSPDVVVSFAGDGASPEQVRRFGDWRASVEHLQRRLAEHAPVAGARFALYDDDPYAFSIGLFALWHAGCVAVLPPNAQPGTLDRLRDAVEGSLGGQGSWLPGRPGFAIDTAPSSEDSRRPSSSPLRNLDPSAPALELFTSGTTGEGKAVPKLLCHLDDEVQVLDATFGEELGAAPIFATASHQHLYGLLFRVLWPLASARPFCSDRVLHGEELFPRLRVRAAIASVPAHLDRLAARAMRGEAAAPPLVFSSGGPLSAATAHSWERASGDAPIEVFGSTETGGVAWRRQHARAATSPWRPFDGVQVSRSPDEQLSVCSSLVSVGDDSNAAPGAGGALVFRMGDRVRILDDGCFEVLGRVDRIVKIGEKRLSLPDMESRLLEHVLVSAVGLVGVELAGQTRVGAAVVLSAEGRERLERDGRRELGRTLSGHLARDFDRILVPRAWRYVDDLPLDAQGKITAARLRVLFDAETGGTAVLDEQRVLHPVVLWEERGARFVEQRCRVPEDLAHLEGHFPGAPIVPGVVQLGWAIDLASELLEETLDPASVEALKFALPLEPAAEFAMRVDVDQAAARVRFRLSDSAREYSSGRLRLRRSEST